ncbi:hypothetical protein [Acetivibrio mesophilus]|uniref:hypothetical protein n=1 Tax=Acetivibrio mesophilus TaxID=2487273 RepID=UPI0012D80029|nr:hypothetical protein [Acetivibrio mesophilus]
MRTDDFQSKADILDEIVAIATHSNDPVVFTRDVAELLLTNGLISEAVYDILMGVN